MSETIVVGVDGTAASRAALDWACHLAGRIGARLVVATVVQSSTERAITIARELVEREVDSVRSTASDVVVSTSISIGSTARELATIGAESNASLIVVGTNKTGFVHGRVFGSRGLQVASIAGRSVAIIPQSSGRARRTVVVGIDPDATHALELATAGARLALVDETDLRIVTADIPTGDRRAENAARAALAPIIDSLATDYPEVTVTTKLAAKPPAEALVAESANARLVVIGSGVAAGDPVLASTAHDVLVNIAGPTLVVGESTGAPIRRVTIAS